MAKKENFKKGDVVVLKSGGPAMTIDKFVWNPLDGKYYDDKVECIWFEGNKENRAVFNTISLEYE